MYPMQLCEAMCRGIANQKKFEKNGNVSTGAMKVGGLCSFISHFCCEGPTKPLTTATMRNVMAYKHSYKLPGNWSSHWVDFVHEEDGGDDKVGVRPQHGVDILQQ